MTGARLIVATPVFLLGAALVGLAYRIGGARLRETVAQELSAAMCRGAAGPARVGANEP